jgi:hypothetical protein
VVTQVDGQVIDQALRLLGCAPRSSEQTIEVRSQHRASVIQREERIEDKLLQLPLPGDRSPGTRIGDVTDPLEVSSDELRVVRILVGL